MGASMSLLRDTAAGYWPATDMLMEGAGASLMLSECWCTATHHWVQCLAVQAFLPSDWAVETEMMRAGSSARTREMVSREVDWIDG